MANEAVRKTLLKCMKKLVRENNFSQISIEDICALTGISRRTFYRYFPDKYSLLEATYFECFFSKLEISETDNFWNLFEKLCEQIYAEQAFFSHAFGVKGQNGFWEETKKTIAPFMQRDFPVTEDIKDIVRFYIYNDIDTLFQLIEFWLKGGCKESPAQFSAFARDSFKVHGRWVYELATNRTPAKFMQHLLDNNNW